MLKRFSNKALTSQPAFAATRGGVEEKLSKRREKNAAEVKKLQNLFNDMVRVVDGTARWVILFRSLQIETRKRERMEEREAMRRDERESMRNRVGLDSTDPADFHERMAQEHMERYRARSQAERAQRKSARSSRGRSRSKAEEEEDDDDEFSDERATYYMSQIRKKASLVANHLEKTAHKFSEEELHDINQQIVDYIQLEKKVAAYVQRTADEFNKAREIFDKEERLKYLDKVKAARQARIPDEKAAREVARDHYLKIRERLEPHLYPKEEL